MGKPSLLLVDDDKNTLDGLVRILQCEGYPVSGASSGYDALKLMSEERFDVVITDMNMPGMDGLTLIHEVRKTKEPVAIVIITANSSVKTGANAVKHMKCDYFLQKPVNIEELKSVLKKIMGETRVIT